MSLPTPEHIYLVTDGRDWERDPAIMLVSDTWDEAHDFARDYPSARVLRSTVQPDGTGSVPIDVTDGEP